MEGKENSEQVPEKIQTILDGLKREQGQGSVDPSTKINMEISTNILTVAGYAQLWEARPQMGTKEEADQLMQLALLKMKKELYKDITPDRFNAGIDYTVKVLNDRLNDPSKISKDPSREDIRKKTGQSLINIIERNKESFTEKINS